MKRLVLVLLLLATSSQAIPLANVLDQASNRFDTLWDNVLLPEELDWYANRGVYAQCLFTQVNPSTLPGHGQAKQEMPVTNVAPYDHPGQTCELIFGPGNIAVSLPFSLAVGIYETPSDGWGFWAEIWLEYDGDTYTMAKNHGPETGRAHDWQQVEESIP